MTKLGYARRAILAGVEIMFGNNLLKSLATAAAVLWAGASFAAPVPFIIDFSTTPSGFTVTGEHVNNGNCPFGTTDCSLVNDNTTIVISNATTLFDILSATFRFQGEGVGNGVLFEGLKLGSVVGSASFKIGASTGFGDGSLSVGATPIDKKIDYLALFNSNFAGIDTFRITSNKVDKKSANLRVDSIAGTVAAVPVPAAGFLLLGALGGLAALRRRRKA